MPLKKETNLQSGELFDRALSNIRHLLSNSVGTLKITLEVLLEHYDQFDESKRTEFLERAVGQVAKQQQLLDSMKTYSRTVVKRLNPINFEAFWQNWVQEKREVLAIRNIRLIVRDFDKPMYIFGEERMLGLVFDAVLANAIEAMINTEDPFIELSLYDEEDLKIVVRDNGPGIEQDQLEKLFIPFYSKSADRSGLGLPLARKLLVSMGGSISIESAPGEGTNVCMWLRQAQRNH